jgi:uncharacterized membrane protein YecN with MAPEG domain
MNIYVLCSAILVILHFVLAFNVSRLRGSLKIGIGSGEHHSGILNRSIRAHGNAAEFIPIFVVLFLYFSSIAASGWIVWVVMAATVSRILHPLGMFMSPDLNKPQVFRFIGALGTYVCGLALGIALLVHALAR